MMKPRKIYLLLGSNMGDRVQSIRLAKAQLEKRIGKILQSSHIYETQPWGDPKQPDYLNAAVEIKTTIPPKDVLQHILAIEKEMGRERTKPMAPRPIDIDILFYDNFKVNEKDLIIPHPLLHERNFALIPLMEIAPEFVHPVFNETIEDLYFQSTDPLEVIMLESED